MLIQKTTCFLSVFVWLSTSLVLVRSEGRPSFKEKVKTRYNVEVGSSVKLCCPVTGTSDPVANRTLVFWSYRSRIVNNNKPKWSRFRIRAGKYLKIVNVNVTDAGVYTCKAYNEFGFIMINITLSIKKRPLERPRVNKNLTGEYEGMPPKFKSSSKRVMSFKTGETAKLKCHSTGDPDPHPAWFKDGQPYGQHKRTSVSPNGWTLNLRYLTVQDSGKYLCRVSNSLGSINRTFIVRVKARIYRPTMDEPNAKQVKVRQGLNTRLECRAWSVGKTEFKWRRWDNGFKRWRDLRASERVYIKLEEYKTRSTIPDQNQFGAILLIRNTTKKDEGNYSCVVKNKYGTDEIEMSLGVLDEGYTTTSMAPPSNSALQTTEHSVPLILVVGLTTSIVVTIIFIVVLILCCRHERKHLEKQYVMEYKPVELLQYQQQTSDIQEMQKEVQQDVNPGNLPWRGFWNQPYGSPVQTPPAVTEHSGTCSFLTSGEKTQCSRNYLASHRDPERTMEFRSSRIADLNIVNSPTPSLRSSSSHKRIDRKLSFDSEGNTDYTDYSPHHESPPTYDSICSSASCYETPTYYEVSHQCRSHHSRESIV